MSANSAPLVSVLTPVYNGEDYLGQCIESVLAQTYQNWEYVIVNNCSTDRTLEIARAYAKKDGRIRIHDNMEFVGCDANGNIAFRQMSAGSKYCKVVHADDWLFPECIEQMVGLAEAHPTVAIVGSYGLCNARVAWDGLVYPSTVVPGHEICRNTLLGGPYVFGSPTSILIRSDQIRKRPSFFNEANPHCDIEVCFDILRDHDFGFVHQVLTFTREHDRAESAFGHRFGTNYIGAIEHLNKYGRTYLNNEELVRCVRQSFNRYYAFLGYKVFRNRDEGFWEFHRKELDRLGHSLSYWQVGKVVIDELLELALNPLTTVRRSFRKMARFFR